MRIKLEVELRRPARRSVALVLGLLLLAVPGVALAIHQFPDVPDGHMFHSEIGAIAKAGITAGFPDGTYRPADPVTRQAMAAFMHRGLGRAGLAVGTPTTTSSIDVPAGIFGNTFVPVRELTMVVPGASKDFSPQQLVHLQGRVQFLTSMSSASKGCPCEFAALIRDTATGVTSAAQFQTFESSSSSTFAYSFDVEALFAAAPGTRTYQLRVRLNIRNNATNAASFPLNHLSSLSAMTFTFGPTGSHTASAPGAVNEPVDVDQLPERRTEE